jgi:Histidine kinase-, DNA gyrase B-, and HSP90-like ATPase
VTIGDVNGLAATDAMGWRSRPAKKVSLGRRFVMQTISAAPSAASLIESMRDLGYSLETALADVIDNSIAAHASKIEVFADTTSPEIRIGVLDDGAGMSETELRTAMRLGSQSPSEARDALDLGRFGLGLKTASFSQCRRLTVASRRNGVTSAVTWDLDRVRETDEWLLEIPDDPASIPWIDQLEEAGTLVVWQTLDRLLERHGSRNEPTDHRHVVRRIDEATEHLELVFHRFLSGERGLKRVEILVNGRPLEPFDPFHARHEATSADPVEKIRIGGQVVTIQAFTLPHHSKVTPSEWERYAGRAGYLKNQGFYVYRAKRLIIHGTWFGLARQTELTKLARVRIDMPNGLDEKWKIDVKKASAQPPRQVKDRLRRIIETIGASSIRVYTGRGRRLVGDDQLPIWMRVQDKGEIRYEVNPDHPTLAGFAKQLPEELRAGLTRVLELTGAALPLDALLTDLGGEPEKVTGAALSDAALEYAVATTVASLRNNGVGDDAIAEMLRVAEPFRSNWQRTELQLDRTLLEAVTGV